MNNEKSADGQCSRCYYTEMCKAYLAAKPSPVSIMFVFCRVTILTCLSGLVFVYLGVVKQLWKCDNATDWLFLIASKIGRREIGGSMIMSKVPVAIVQRDY